MNRSIKKKNRIETNRLVLKPYSPGDGNALTALLQNEEISKTFMILSYGSAAEYEALAEKLIRFSQPEDTVHLEYGIYRGDELIGFLNDCGYDDDSIEIGYVIHPNHWGNGYATEALTAILQELRDMGFAAVRAAFFEENTASYRVMEKCGMVLTGEAEEVEYRGVTRRCPLCEIRFDPTEETS